MTTIIAVMRVSDTNFIYYDLIKKQFGEEFTVIEGDDYFTKSYSQIVFAEYDEVKGISQDISSITVRRTTDQKEEILKDLPEAEQITIIESIYKDIQH